ncbi:MAG: hypothetical protein WA055_00065 [Candidatus Moraniibacteriota bacterium]
MIGNPEPFDSNILSRKKYEPNETEDERRYNSYTETIGYLTDQLANRAEAKLGELYSLALEKKYTAFEERARESGIELGSYTAFRKLIGEDNEEYSKGCLLDLPEDSKYNVKKFIINLTKEFYTEQEIYREEIARLLKTFRHKIKEVFGDENEGEIRAYELQTLLFNKITQECPQETSNYASWDGLIGSSFDGLDVSKLLEMELDFPVPYNIKEFFLKLIEKLDKSEDKSGFISELEKKFADGETMEEINTFLES